MWTQYSTCIHRAGKHVDIRLFHSEETEIPDTCPDPEKSLNLQSTCSWDANMVSCTWGQEDMLCYYKAPLSHNAPGCSVYLSTPPKKLSKEDSSSVVAVLPKTSFTISISVSTSLSSACSTGSHNHLINFCPSSCRYMHTHTDVHTHTHPCTHTHTYIHKIIKKYLSGWKSDVCTKNSEQSMSAACGIWGKDRKLHLGSQSHVILIRFHTGRHSCIHDIKCSKKIGERFNSEQSNHDLSKVKNQLLVNGVF